MPNRPSHMRRDWIENVILAILVLSLAAGLLLRTYRMDWDRGHPYLFHPDERALVYSAISNISFPLPPDLPKLLRPDSPLNPHFFNYGNLPMYLTRATAHVLSFFIKNAWTNEQLWLSGRSLSALFDLTTVLIAFLLGRKLYGRRVGLLAAVFGSFTVLHIQLSHFLTVDTFLTTFITLGMYFAVDIVRKGSLKAGLLMGAALGLAMGTKVSVAPLAVSIVVAWGLWAWRGSSEASAEAAGGLTFGDRLAKGLLGILLALLAAGVCFVVTMPYAIIDWTSFVRSVNEQSRMVRGIADFPYTRQYLNTPIFLYQLWHSAVWGMGIPLGIVAYAGFVMIVLRTLVRRRSEEIVLLSWVLVYFLINGIFQVKFLRYMLPLFPFLVIFGAEFLWQLWDWAAKTHRLDPRAFFRIPVAHALEHENDYLALDAEAEAWEREKAQRIERPAKPARRPARPRRRARQISVGLLSPEQAEGVAAEPTEEATAVGAPPSVEEEAEPEAVAVEEQSPPPVSPVSPEVEQPAPEQIVSPATVTAPPAERLPVVEAIEEAAAAPPEPQPFSWQAVREAVACWTRGQYVVALLMTFVVLSTIFYALAFMNVYRQTHPWITISEWIYRNVPPGSTIANEHWDDALPLGRRVDGRHRTFEEYKHVEMKNYEDDNQAKLDMLIANIQQTDYIILATNRLYVTISRLPERYPVTKRYYELLFAEKLGFKLVAYSSVYPSFLGITIKDDTFVDPALPRPELVRANVPSGLVINLGKADESFTVYDHPMPLVFQKVERIPEPQLRAMFAGTVQLAQQYQQKRQAASRPAARVSSKTFLLTESERTAQESGGTYMALFNPDSVANRLPVVVWWLAVELMALLVLPIGFVLFANLRDRGYLLGKTLGLLLVAYPPWLAASLKIIPFGRASILLSMAIVAVVSAVILYRRQRQMLAWLRDHRWLILVSEALFTVAFLVFVGIRILNPDLWQPWSGGEKPMEFAFLGAIARSTYFPPYDPFFAGGYINYYYYGQYICAMLIRLVGVMPSIGFNLVIPLLFALTVANAFSITYNLVAALRKQPYTTEPSSANSFLASHGSLLAWALAGALFVAVIGNLSTIGEVFKGPWNRGQTTIKSSIPGLSAVARVLDGTRKGLQPGQRLFESFNYWNPSRVIPETINEFPYWSFLFADLHPHTIGIPFTLLVLGLALNLIKERRQTPLVADNATTADDIAVQAPPPAINRALAWIQERFSGIRPEDVPSTLVMGLAVGALGVINTWDLPTYLGIVLCVVILRGWIESGRLHLTEIVVRFGAIVLLGLLLYLPFYQKYEALASGIGLVRNRTQVGYYLAIYGFFLFSIISFMVVDASLHRRAAFTRLLCTLWRYFDDVPLVVHRVQKLARPRHTFLTALYALLIVGLSLVLLALLKQWIFVLLLPLLLASVVLGLAGRSEPERVFVWLLAFTGFLVSIGIEVFFLRDWLQGGSAYRMNTLFKFGIQVWVFLALASAVGLSVVTGRIRLSSQRLVSAHSIWYVCLALLLFCVFLFPVIGTPARVNDRFPGARPPTGTLDGTAFMSVGKYTFDWERKNHQVDLRYDYEAIQWLLRNVQGSPVIAEAVLPYYRELGARVSAFTGMPTLVGNQHEQEQRPGDTQVGPRENEARTLFSDASFENIIPLLKKHRVRYIYVGQLEQAIYPPAGLAKFDQAVGSYLDLVFENARVKIFRVRDR